MSIKQTAAEVEVDEFLAHHGVLGMHWGVRRQYQSTGVSSGQSSLKIDSNINKDTASAAKDVAGLMAARYGLDIKNVKAIDPHGPMAYSAAYVENNSVFGGRNEGTIFVRSGDLSKLLKDAEKADWVAPGTGNARGLMTHESFHAAFHSQEYKKASLGGPKTVGGHRDERNKALKAAIDEAYRTHVSVFSTSGYARASQTREELEAEMFSQYNWADNPASFVVAYGKTLNKALGVDPTPFKDVVG